MLPEDVKTQKRAVTPIPIRDTGEVFCAVAKRCGGCQWMGRDYREQLHEKEKQVRKILTPYCRLEGIVGMDQPLYYRNKVHAVFGEDQKHRPISGIYEERTHRIVPVDSCLIENQAADAIIVSIRELLSSFKIRPYNEDTGYGLLRHVLIHTGRISGQIMVVLVLASPILPSKNNFVKALLKRHPDITQVILSGQSGANGSAVHKSYGICCSDGLRDGGRRLLRHWHYRYYCQ